MRASFGNSVLALAIGNIAQFSADVLVTAANANLAGGGGVDGAIHAAAGSLLLQELKRRYPEGCPPGSAVATSAGHLPAKAIVHAVGPVWTGGRSGEPEQLRSAYQASIELAVGLAARSIAFPAISTGAYRYPLDLAASCAVNAIADDLEHRVLVQLLVTVVLFDQAAYGAFSRALEERGSDRTSGALQQGLHRA